MKENMMQQLAAVIRALDNVSVCGRQNLANLSGSISVLEDLMKQIAACEINEDSAHENKTGDA